jgi:hypothetical protein
MTTRYSKECVDIVGASNTIPIIFEFIANSNRSQPYMHLSEIYITLFSTLKKSKTCADKIFRVANCETLIKVFRSYPENTKLLEATTDLLVSFPPSVVKVKQTSFPQVERALI